MVVSFILEKFFPDTSTDTTSDGTDNEEADRVGFLFSGPFI